MSIKLVFKEENEELFWKYWNEMAKKASYRYFPTNLKTYNYGGKNDKSFVYLVNNQLAAGVFLPIEKIEKFFINAPIFKFMAVSKEIFKIINKIAVENGIKKIMFEIDPLENYSYNYLQKYGYLDATILSYVVDLTVDDLLATCRKGCRNDIKSILKDKNFSVFFIDKNNADYNIHKEYRELHKKCAGKETRAKKTFDWQFERLKEGKAVLFGLKYKNKNIAYSYFEFNKEKGVYYSSADDPDYDRMHIYHILIYSAMEYLKKKGVKFLDMGQPASPSLQFNYYPDKKQINIALFKRGFGGEFRPLFRGIKYFSEEAFKKDIKEFIDNYFQAIV